MRVRHAAHPQFTCRGLLERGACQLLLSLLPRSGMKASKAAATLRSAQHTRPPSQAMQQEALLPNLLLAAGRTDADAADFESPMLLSHSCHSARSTGHTRTRLLARLHPLTRASLAQASRMASKHGYVLAFFCTEGWAPSSCTQRQQTLECSSDRFGWSAAGKAGKKTPVNGTPKFKGNRTARRH